MKLIVKKYGGTSVATPTKIKNIAKKIAEESDSNRLVIVLSAMGKTTDNLVSLAKKCSKNPNLMIAETEPCSLFLLLTRCFSSSSSRRSYRTIPWISWV